MTASHLARSFTATSLAFAALVGALSQPVWGHDDNIALRPIGRVTTGLFNQGAAEIVAYDPGSRRLFSIIAGSATVDIVDISVPSAPVLIDVIDLSPFGAVTNSVAVHDGLVAVAVGSANRTDPGTVALFDAGGAFLSAVKVGALPDMLTFTPNGRWLLVANEGEPSDDYLVDPEGSVSVIDVSGDPQHLTEQQVRTARFEHFNRLKLVGGLRSFGPRATIAQDLEPEFITVADNSRVAWVTLQENNAIAVLDIVAAKFLAVVGLGFKDHSLAGNGFDASNRDGAINIARWPVSGMYQPDAIASYYFKGRTFLVTANEGDSRDYPGFSEEARIGALRLDPTAFPNAADLQRSSALGRLKVSTANGDVDGDGDYDRLFAYGARSFSIWTATGQLVFDSGDDFEQITAAALPADFNSSDEENGSFDDRSDDKGPEPEGVALGKIRGRTYAFIGLERIGGIMVYDITKPTAARFVQYINTRDFAGDPLLGTAGDLAPEGILFIPAEDSPNDRPLLIVGFEVSGSATIFEIEPSGYEEEGDDD